MAYKIYFIMKAGGVLDNIGNTFKEKREEINIAPEEVAEDLSVKVEQVVGIESGDRHVFTDIFELKDFIRVYAKYLGLDPKAIVDEFNEYLFDFTSKIPLQAIEAARLEKDQKPEEIKSPYTKPVVEWRPYIVMGSIFLVLVLGLLITYLIVYFTNSDALSGFVN